MPPVVEQVGSAGSGMQLSSNSGSPVSGAGDGPIGAMVQQQAAFQIFPLRQMRGCRQRLLPTIAQTMRMPIVLPRQNVSSEPLLTRCRGHQVHSGAASRDAGPLRSICDGGWTISCTSTLPGSRAPRRGCGYRSWNCEGYVGDYVRSSETTRDL
jgi:hypothetical protein